MATIIKVNLQIRDIVVVRKSSLIKSFITNHDFRDNVQRVFLSLC